MEEKENRRRREDREIINNNKMRKDVEVGIYSGKNNATRRGELVLLRLENKIKTWSGREFNWADNRGICIGRRKSEVVLKVGAQGVYARWDLAPQE